MTDDITSPTAGVGRALAAPAAAGALGLALLVAPCGAQAADGHPASVPSTQAGADATALRPFSYRASDEELAQLRRRIAETRWPDKETVADHSQGAPLATIRGLADYWATEYDWRKAEERLNALPQFITELDGLDIHFIHVRSKHKNALPLIVTHGWPGSILEQAKIIGPSKIAIICGLLLYAVIVLGIGAPAFGALVVAIFVASVGDDEP